VRYAIVIRVKLCRLCAGLAGCVATGATIQDTETLIREAIEFHLEGLRADNLPIPPPSSHVEYVEVSA
jgi:predicted RNase H-like HicB family nuclease